MKEKIYPMKLDNNYYVVSANDLIKGKQKMTLREAQLLFITISQVVYEDTDFKTYTTTVSKLAEFMKIDENSLYRDLKSICKSLCQQIVEIQIGGENAKKNNKWRIFHWVQSAEYDNGNLTIRLSDDIKPYLLELEKYYSQSLLGILMTFRSYYATRLYQYLLADSNSKRGFKEEWTFTCEELRELFNVEEKQYSRTYNLIQRTIRPALDELNESDYVHVWDYRENRKKNVKGKPPIESVSFKIAFFEDRQRKEFFVTKSKDLIDEYNSEKHELSDENFQIFQKVENSLQKLKQ